MTFNYVVLRYVHDTAVAESLNIGIVLVSEESGYINCSLEYDTDRLAATFRGFDARSHQEAMKTLERLIHNMGAEVKDTSIQLTLLRDAAFSMRLIWPDAGLNYQISSRKVGISEDLDATLTSLFNRFVTDQSPERVEARR